MSLVAALLLVSLLPPALGDDAAIAEAELQQIRAHFAERPRPETLAALESLAGRFPSLEASGRALLWLGDLELGAQKSAAARGHYAEARRRFPRGEIGPLAARGLANVALFDGDWDQAIAEIDRALDGAGGVLRIELLQKRALAVSAKRRAWGEAIAWTLVGIAFAWFGLRLIKTRQFGLPMISFYLTPVYLLLIGGCWGRDPAVLRALLWLAGGSLAVATVAFAGAPATGKRRLAADGALLALAHLSLFWIAIRRAGIVDVLWNTVHGGADHE